MGASASTDNGFNFHYTGTGHFDAGVKVVDLGDLGVKLSVGPQIEVKIDFGSGRGFDLGAGADGFEEATMNLSGLLGLENWHYHVDAGAEASLEGLVDVPLLGVNVGGKENFPSPVINLVDAWGTGDLDVSSSTTGKDIFPGQIYRTAVARSSPSEASTNSPASEFSTTSRPRSSAKRSAKSSSREEARWSRSIGTSASSTEISGNRSPRRPRALMTAFA